MKERNPNKVKKIKDNKVKHVIELKEKWNILSINGIQILRCKGP